MVTLHAYVLRELLKTLILTVTALTVLFTMGGGLYNVIAFEGVSAGDVFRFLPLLIPIVVTLTLPMAALFSATMVYGRLAADNELVACRAAGINIQRLFAGAVLLAVFVAAFSLVFGNFVIPEFALRIERFARNNLRDMVAQHLQYDGFIQRREKDGGDRYTLTAERVRGVSTAALQEKGFETGPELHYLLISNPTFLHVDGDGDLVRFTVARHGLCLFDTRPTPIEATFFVHDARDFEVGKRAVYVGEQQIGPIKVPLPKPFKLSATDLRTLLYWREAPWAAPTMREDVTAYLTRLKAHRFYEHCARALAGGGTLELADERSRRYRITAAEVTSEGRQLALRDGRIELHHPGEPQPTVYEAQRVEVRGRPLPSGDLFVEITLIRTLNRDVLVYEPQDAAHGAARHKPTLSLDGAQVPDAVLEEVRQYTPAAVVDRAATIEAPQELANQRASLQNAADELRRKIVGTIHFRLGYTSSALVTVLMGAILGVIFRGARALAAFALAMIPFFSVTILMVLGRQLTEDEMTTSIGPAVTWGGLVLVLIADLVILRVGVRR